MPDPFPSETLREIADRARVALGADQALVLPLAGGEPLPPGPEGGPSLSAPDFRSFSLLFGTRAVFAGLVSRGRVPAHGSSDHA